MNNKEKLEKDIIKHARNWDCYNDAPTEINHTGKLMKLFRINSVAFAVFCAENYKLTYWGEDKEWFSPKTGGNYTTEQLYKLWENEK